jgi:hypothetical protein
MATSLAKNQIPINQLCREIINKKDQAAAQEQRAAG